MDNGSVPTQQMPPLQQTTPQPQVSQIPSAMPQVSTPPQPQMPSPPPQGSSHKNMLFTLLTILAVAILGSAGYYFLSTSFTPKNPPDTTAQTNYTPPKTVKSTPTPQDPIDAESQAIDRDLDALSSASAEVDAGLSDQQTDLTP